MFPLYWARGQRLWGETTQGRLAGRCRQRVQSGPGQKANRTRPGQLSFCLFPPGFPFSCFPPLTVTDFRKGSRPSAPSPWSLLLSPTWSPLSLFLSVLGTYVGFPGGSAGEESACNAGDLGSIPGSGRYPAEGKGCPLQYSWASLVVQLVKNLPAMQEAWVRSLGREDALQKGKAAHSSALAWRIPWTACSMGSHTVGHG